MTPTQSATASTPTTTSTPVLTATVGITATVAPTATAPLTVTSAQPPITSTVATLNAAAGVTATADAYGRLPLSFEPNRGQVSSAVQFLSHGPGFALYLTGTGATLTLQAHNPRHAFAHGRAVTEPGALSALTQTAPISESVIRLRFSGANTDAQPSAEDQLPGVANYLIGSDPSGWHTAIPTYKQVSYRGVYPGVDLVYYGHAGALEYDWQVAPGADPNAISFAVEGAQGLSLDGRGNLLVQTSIGALEQHAPLVYQDVNGQRQTISAAYALSGTSDIVSFAIGAYDTSKPLIIDPILSYSTYLGGSNIDGGAAIAVDAAGDAYVAGSTSSTNFPTQSGLQASNAGSSDAFVAKLNPSGAALVYSTYLGGSNQDYGAGIAVDSGGDAYLTGYTWSNNFPLQNARQAAFGGAIDAFVAKLNPSGNGLLYSTYLGGSNQDFGDAIAVDGTGSAYVTGQTYSADFPTQSALQGTCGSCSGASDTFVTKFSADGSTLAYSTYLGGSSYDYGQAIAVDGAGNAYITGATSSANFPVQGALQGTNGGGYDAFVTKLTADGGTIVYSTYLGGTGNEVGHGIAVDGPGDAYITGNTQSTNYPIQNALQTGNGGGYDAFVTQLSADGSALVYSTYLGGNSDEDGYGIAVDGMGDAYVTGDTFSGNFPTCNPVQSTPGGGSCHGGGACSDAFVTQLSADGSALAYSTYLGGNSDDHGEGIAVDGAGNAYVTGETFSTNFPTVTPIQASYGGAGYQDAFVAKLADTTACPGGWGCNDIGNPTIAGDQTLNAGVWSINGAGSDIGGASDQFHYVSQSVTGDSAMSARVTGQTATGTYAKAGLMYRASQDAADVYYDAVVTPANGHTLQIQYRASAGGNAGDLADVSVTLPLYLRIGRAGTTFTTYTSTDGTTWTALANSSISIPNMPPTAMAGMAVDSYNPAASSTVNFDGVSLTGITDLVQLDTATEHYTQTVGAPSGLTNLQLYNNPVGLSGATGWLPRDPSLSVDTTTGMLAPATLPFGLHIAPTAGITTLASLVSEDGISLGVGLARAPAAVTGQVSGSTVTYPGVFTSTAPLTTTVDDGVQGAGTNQFNYIGSTWVHCTAPPSGSNCSPIYYNGTNSASRTLNDYATLTFTGTGIVYYASEDTNRGYAAVSLDGGGETLVDLGTPKNYHIP